MYIYELPYLSHKELCCILDQNNKWEELGAIYMKLPKCTMIDVRNEMNRGRSPTDKILNIWGGQYNHTIEELFLLLKKMEHYHAMSIIKSFVDPRLLINFEIPKCKQYDIPKENFNKSEKILNINKLAPVNLISNENNESLAVVPVDNRVLLKPKSPTPLAQLGATSRNFTASDISCVAECAGGIPQIPYEELKKSTNDWSSSVILGKGGFGTVYKGIWKCTQVAIKKLETKDDNPKSHNEQIKQSITELHCLNTYRHDNILPLYGYSIGGPEPCLIYQYMSGGSLDNRLRIRDETKVLDWYKRLNIAVGTARGLQFLHTVAIGDKPLIHGDIKSANILLDLNDMPRIGDFGLAREGPQSNYTHIKVSRIHGTRPYLPDEFLRAKKFSTKVDTYSFGIVLFEIATGLSAYAERREHKFLRDHVVNFNDDIIKLKDPRAAGGEEYYMRLIEIGRKCVNKKSKDRPEMVNVLVELEGHR